MTPIAAALQEGDLTWRSGDLGRFELRRGDEVFASIRDDEVVIEERRMQLRDIRGQKTLFDLSRGARVATLRLVGHHTGRVGAVTLAHHRVRVSKVAVNPFRWEVTDDLGGPQLLVGTKLFGRLRIGAGSDFDPEMDAGLTAVAMALTAVPEVDPILVGA